MLLQQLLAQRGDLARLRAAEIDRAIAGVDVHVALHRRDVASQRVAQVGDLQGAFVGFGKLVELIEFVTHGHSPVRLRPEWVAVGETLRAPRAGASRPRAARPKGLALTRRARC